MALAVGNPHNSDFFFDNSRDHKGFPFVGLVHSHLRLGQIHKTSPTGWGPQDSVNRWFISGLTMVYGRYNELVNGDYFMVYKYV